MTATVGSIASLHRYPVKSMMGEDLDAAYLTPRGLLGDRAYALCDSETGKVVSAKNPRKWPDMFRHHAAYVAVPAAGLEMPPVRVTFPDGATALSSSPDFSPALSAKLGRAVELLARPPRDPQLEEFWPDREDRADGDVVTDEAMPAETFYDLAVSHVLTSSTLDSLREVNSRSRFEPRRFRPNVIVDTGDRKGFLENDWIGKRMAIGPEVLIQITGPCPRCVMITLAQGDLPKDPDILKTAARKNEGHVGAYASIVQPGTIRVGDKLALI
jgi:uncharacterized protein